MAVCGHDANSGLHLNGGIPELPEDVKPALPARIVKRVKGKDRAKWGLEECVQPARARRMCARPASPGTSGSSPAVLCCRVGAVSASRLPAARDVQPLATPGVHILSALTTLHTRAHAHSHMRMHTATSSPECLTSAL